MKFKITFLFFLWNYCTIAQIADRGSRPTGIGESVLIPKEYLQTLRELILSCNVPAITSSVPLHRINVRQEVNNIDGVSTPCAYETWEAVVKYDEIISLDPNTNSVWPGSVIQGASLIRGTPATINLPRKQGYIYLDGIVFNDDKPNSAIIENPTEAEVKNAINTMLRRPIRGTVPRFSYSIEQTESVEESFMKLGLSAKWASGEVSGQLSTNDYNSKKTFLVKLVQKYYTVSFQEPSSPESVFKNDVKAKDARPYMKKENPPALISSVNYGRILILSFSTTESSEKFNAALQASFSAWGATGKVDFSAENKATLSNSDLKVFAIGGSAGTIAKIITGNGIQSKIDELNDYIKQGAEFSLYSLATPIGYKAIYLADNKIASLNIPYSFEKPKCEYVPYIRNPKITIDEFIINDVTDNDEDMAFSYKIEFYNQANQVIDAISNRKDAYVEEPGKVGRKDGVNRFFINESKAVIGPVFGIKLSIWAESDDEDCDKPWGEDGRTVERYYGQAELLNTSNNQQLPIFRPWGCIDVVLRLNR